jgi:hypothetical protein
VEYILDRQFPPEVVGSLQRAASLVLARGELQAEMRRRQALGGKFKGELRDLDPELWGGERWWQLTAKRWNCIPHHVRYLNHLKNGEPTKPDLFDAVRRSQLTSTNELRVLDYHRDMKTAEDRTEVVSRYASSATHRRGKQVLRRAIEDYVREKRRDPETASVVKGKRWDTLQGDLIEASTIFPDGMFDLVVADIPYADVATAEKVAQLAARVLRDGAYLVIIYGQRAHAEIVSAVSRHLPIVAIGHWDQPGTQWPCGPYIEKVTEYPIVFAAKGTPPPLSRLGFISPCPEGQPEKQWHPWQKALGATLELVTSLVPKESLILDPTCGGGTTGEAALRHACRFVGIDVDPIATEATRARLTLVDRELGAAELTDVLRKYRAEDGTNASEASE